MNTAYFPRAIVAAFLGILCFLTAQAQAVPQTIVFNPPIQADVSDIVDLAATGGGSGNPVIFTVTTGPGLITGGTELSFVGVGAVTVTATQAGAGEFEPAVPVARIINARENTPPFLLPDVVTISNSTASLSPLANDIDADGDLLSVVSVSDPAVIIRGRDLIFPPGFSSDFTYEATDGIVTMTANVDVQNVPAIEDPRRFSGLLYNSSEAVAGWIRMVVNPKGSTTLQITDGPRRGSGVFTLNEIGGTVQTTLGALTFARNLDNTINVSLVGGEGTLVGVLRPGPMVTTAERHHIALTNVGNLGSVPPGWPRAIPPAPSPVVTEPLPGGGYIIVRIRRAATATVSGKLCDGTPFTAGATLNDINVIAFYAVTTVKVVPRGYVGGELLKADLERTDMTGELVYFKPPQPGSRYAHRDGINTVLQANGSIFLAANVAGSAYLVMAGGNLAADEESLANVFFGKVFAQESSLVDWVPRLGFGTFTAKIRVPFARKAIGGMGVYLPKTQRAWGYFNGSSVGGRIDLSVDGSEFPQE